MWNTPAAVTPPASANTLLTMLNNRGFDTQYTPAVYWGYFNSIFDFILVSVTFVVFSRNYQIASQANITHWEHLYDNYGFDESGFN